MKNIFIIWILIFIFFVGLAGNMDAGEIDALLKDEQAELEALRKKIARQEKAISKAGAKESTVLKNLHKIGSQLKLKERELSIYQWNYKNNQKKISSLEPRLNKAERKIKNHKKVLGLHLRAIYKEGPISPLKIVFPSNNVTDLLQQLKYMNLIARQDLELFQQYKNRYKQIEQDKRSLFAVRAKLVNLKKNTLSKKREIEITKKKNLLF